MSETAYYAILSLLILSALTLKTTYKEDYRIKILPFLLFSLVLVISVNEAYRAGIMTLLKGVDSQTLIIKGKDLTKYSSDIFNITGITLLFSYLLMFLPTTNK